MAFGILCLPVLFLIGALIYDGRNLRKKELEKKTENKIIQIEILMISINNRKIVEKIV